MICCENIALDAESECLENIALDVERKKLKLYLKFKDDVRVKLNDVRIMIVLIYSQEKNRSIIYLRRYCYECRCVRIC